jgi:DNA polymerase III delta subunit
LAERRLVVVKNGLKEKTKELEIIEILDSVPDSTVMIIVENDKLAIQRW